jgi:hypothetical protein
MHEELAYEWEALSETDVPRLRKASISTTFPDVILNMVSQLSNSARTRAPVEVHRKLDKIINAAIKNKW